MVVGLALLLLTVVFRSILVPIKAVAGFLLTIAASMGLVVWIFQDGNLAELFGVAQAGPIVSFLPVLLIGILFGLAMDYEVFLVSRMREELRAHRRRARESVITGYGQSGRVVTAAALIMIGVFGAFVLDADPVIKSIGLVAGVRRARGRLHRPDDARSGRDGAARRARLVAARAGSTGSCPTSTSRARP